MKDLQRLLEIAESLGCKSEAAELSAIQKRQNQPTADIILPLVGEFSSGKTTLINALTDSKALETATEPTTATIYEIHFGADECKAVVTAEDGTMTEVGSIAELKNDNLADAKYVTVFDTSKRIPSSTILADTPGLSSPDPRHKQTLVDFLPMADGILLVSDVNQQITRSLTEFIETMKLSKRPIYLVLTKSDTKSGCDVEAAKKYISDNCKIPLEQMAVVSAATGKLEQMYSLLDVIQNNKKEILQRVYDQRCNDAAQSLSNTIDELMRASVSDEGMQDAICDCKRDLNNILRGIDRLAESVSDEIEDCAKQTSRKFEDLMFQKLNALAAGKSSNFDSEAVSIINMNASLLMNDFRTSVHSVIAEAATKRKFADDETDLSSLKAMDLSFAQMGELGYNLDMNSMGHQYDSMISNGLSAVSTVLAPGKAILGKALSFASTNGIVDSIVGWATDNLVAKPQRLRATRNYIEGTLAPEFKQQLSSISNSIVESVRNHARSAASDNISQKEQALNELRNQMKEKKDAFNQRMTELREYKLFLSNL